MKATRLTSSVAVAVAVAAAVALAAPAYADQDSDFDNRMRYYEVYAPHDFDRYLIKTICELLRSGNFPDDDTARNYLVRNIKADTTEQQTYQILGTGIAYYCPEQLSKFEDMPIAMAAAAAARR